MTQLAAHYIYDGKGTFIKNGLLKLDDQNCVVSLESMGDRIKEMPNIQFYSGILLPGIINSHCHIELSHVELDVYQKGMAAFCQAIMHHKSISSKPEEVDKCMEKVDMDFYHEGIVAVVDICNTASSFELKQKSKIHYHSFVEVLGLNPLDSSAQITSAQQLRLQAEQMNLSASITPHAPYSLSIPLFKACVRESINDGILSIHNQESIAEQELFTRKNGAFIELFGTNCQAVAAMYSQAYLRVLSDIAADTHLLMVHNTFTNSYDYEQIMEQHPHTSWVLCPNSNIFIENRLPHVKMLLDKKARICIGTDSKASNESLSMLSELQCIHSHFPEVTLAEMLQWICINGAEALGLSETLGSFDVGKKPGVALLEHLDLSNMQLQKNTVLRRISLVQ